MVIDGWMDGWIGGKGHSVIFVTSFDRAIDQQNQLISHSLTNRHLCGWMGGWNCWVGRVVGGWNGDWLGKMVGEMGLGWMGRRWVGLVG